MSVGEPDYGFPVRGGTPQFRQIFKANFFLPTVGGVTPWWKKSAKQYLKPSLIGWWRICTFLQDLIFNAIVLYCVLSFPVVLQALIWFPQDTVGFIRLQVQGPVWKYIYNTVTPLLPYNTTEATYHRLDTPPSEQAITPGCWESQLLPGVGRTRASWTPVGQ